MRDEGFLLARLKDAPKNFNPADRSGGEATLELTEAKVAVTQENTKKPAKKGTGSLDDLARTALRAFLDRARCRV